MTSVRGEITRVLLRLSRIGEPRSRADEPPKRRNRPRLSFAKDAEFGPYIIQHRLGSGGMGEVFLAIDRRLKRKVALKFLSPDLVSDGESLRRMRAEAETASALNHPNILTIYEVGELDGHYYIASEFVEGETLRSAMNKRSLDMQGMVDVMCQVLSALSAAHAAGVVHRDLKPGNIMIRPDGYAKVIDFGLAKRARSSTDERASLTTMTRPGLVVGTVYYMSPQQACGDVVDHRTDIWSIGVILYEAIMHRRPFDADADSRVLLYICSKTPAEIPEGTPMPTGLREVIHRALEKNPDDRYQSSRAMLDELSAVGTGSFSGRIATVPRIEPKRRSASPFLIGYIACAAISAGLFLFLYFQHHNVFGESWLKLQPVRQLTFNGGTETARISPDGKYLAYVTGDANGLESLYLRQIDSGSEELKIPPQNVAFSGLTFTPDSQSLLVVEKDTKKIGRLFAVPLFGSKSPVPLVVDVDGPVAFSPDGKQFAFVRYAPTNYSRQRSEDAVYVASSNGSAVRRLFSAQKTDLYRKVIWSPDGGTIALLGSTASGQIVLLLSNLNGQVKRLPLPDWRRVGQPVWSRDSKRIAVTVASGIESDVQAQVWQIDIRSGKTQQITHDLQGYRELSSDADGKTLAAIRQESEARIWISDDESFFRGSSSTAENERYPTLNWMDGTSLLVNSRRNGFPNLWLFDIANQTRNSFTHEAAFEQSAVAVPGTKTIVFVSNRAGGFHLWKFDGQTNAYQQLTFGSAYEELPSITPDGQAIFFNSWQGNTPQIQRVSINGGATTRVGDFAAQNPHVAPDGRSLLCLVQDPNTLAWQPSILALSQSLAVTRIQPVPFARSLARWSPDGKSVSTVITDPRGTSNVWRVPLDGAKPEQVTRFDEGTISAFDWSPDGSRLACLRVSLGSDVVLFRNISGR